MYKIGISTDNKFDTDKSSLIKMKTAGIDAIELCKRSYTDFDFKSLKRSADETDIALWSIHSHMSSDFDISSLDYESNQRAIKEFKWLIDKISDVEIDKIVIHPTHTPEPFDDATRFEKIKHAMECLDALAEYAYKKGVWIALENLPRTCLCNTVDEHLYMLSANDKLRVCFDLNHSLIDKTEDYILKVGERIITIHVSDRDNINERHWLPGEGILNWNAIIDAFQKINYKGVWMYEIGPDAPPTIERRVLTFEDFVVNAKSIFNKQKPINLGTPKPNLGLWGPKN